jgi:hypothetical protein
MAPGPVVTPIQRIGQGMSRLSDGDPSNNLAGITDVAVGAIQAITPAGLDKYLRDKGLELSQLTFPKIGEAMRDMFSPEKVIASSIKNGIKSALENNSEEKQREEEAKKKADEAEAETRKVEAARVAEARRLEQERFVRGDRNGLEQDSRESRERLQQKAKVSLI